MEHLGSARVSRAGFGVSPKQSFLEKVRDGRDAVASTRDARATQNYDVRDHSPNNSCCAPLTGFSPSLRYAFGIATRPCDVRLI